MDIMKLQETPYKKGGRTLDGADCYGLLVLYFRHILGIELLDYPGIHGTDEENSKLFLSKSYTEWSKTNSAQPNDVLLFIGVTGHPSHVGVMVDCEHVLQTTEKHGCTCIKLSRLKGEIHSIYRHKKLI